MANIPPRFLSTGISQVSVLNAQTSYAAQIQLPENSSALLPSEDSMEPSLQYAKAPPTVQNRALGVLKPDLSQVPEITLRTEYHSLRDSLNHLFQNPSEALVNQLQDPDGSNWLLDELQAFFPENEANFSILEAGSNALRPA